MSTHEPNAYHKKHHQQMLQPQQSLSREHPPRSSTSSAGPQYVAAASTKKSSAPPHSQIPSQNRVFGLTKDLTGPSAESAHLIFGGRTLKPRRSCSNDSLATTIARSPSITSHSSVASGSGQQSAGTANQSSKGKDGPRFSVEVVAPAFDKRGYPVFSGRASKIRGYLRTRPVEGCEIIIRLSARTTQGALATLWDGVALMPNDQGNEKVVFQIEDRIVLNQKMARLQPGAHPSSTNRDDYIYTVPFEMTLPMGVSTRIVNGESTTTAVALPPSYEISSENDARERESTKANSIMRSSAASFRSKNSRMLNGLGSTVKEVVEKNLGEVYRIGCFYKICFLLQTIPTAPVETSKKLWGKKKKKKVEGVLLDEITIPFLFTGEPTLLPPPPHYIPLSLVAPVLLRPNTNLGVDWDCERDQAKWSGNFFQTAKRTVDLEMHMPSPAVLQAPSVFPVILIIRPADPLLLASIPDSIHGLFAEETETIHDGKSMRSLRSSMVKAKYSKDNLLPSSDKEPDELDGKLSRFMKSSLSLGKKSSNANMSSSSGSMSTVSPQLKQESQFVNNNPTRGSFASTFARRKPDTRPNTAPNSGGSSSDTRGTGSTIGTGGQYTGNLSGLVRVSLLQTTYCASNSPSEQPKSRRKLISEAEMEEVDMHTMMEEMRAEGCADDQGNEALVQHVHAKGIRIVKGLIRVGTDATPSFRCQGIEVKYAIKVDLIPFSNKKAARGGGGSKSGGSAMGDSSVNQSRSSFHHNASSSSPSIAEGSATPPLPPFPAEHRRNQHSISSTITPDPSSTTQSTSTLHSYATNNYQNSHPQHRPNYTPSVAVGLNAYGANSTIVNESALSDSRLQKGVGALWADVRMVRSGFSS
ncbi:hypothetical protein CBS101457_005144 [Exobasidium rhododendri]|nr:hypothetical protein CBS101457_005144 [Exobasidium rhododendri]